MMTSLQHETKGNKMITHLTDAQISNLLNADLRMQRIQRLRDAVRERFPLQSGSGDVFAAMLGATRGERGDRIDAKLEQLAAQRIRRIYDSI